MMNEYFVKIVDGFFDLAKHPAPWIGYSVSLVFKHFLGPGFKSWLDNKNTTLNMEREDKIKRVKDNSNNAAELISIVSKYVSHIENYCIGQISYYEAQDQEEDQKIGNLASKIIDHRWAGVLTDIQMRHIINDKRFIKSFTENDYSEISSILNIILKLKNEIQFAQYEFVRLISKHERDETDNELYKNNFPKAFPENIPSLIEVKNKLVQILNKYIER